MSMGRQRRRHAGAKLSWLERFLETEKVVGVNPIAPTILFDSLD